LNTALSKPALVLALLLVVTILPAHRSAQLAPEWLDYLNDIRARAHLSPVTEDPVLSDGAHKHAAYIVLNDELQHAEDPAKPGYTPEGEHAAVVGLGAGWPTANFTYRNAIDSWLAGPMHGVHLLNPRLSRVGFGIFADSAGAGIKGGATLDLGEPDFTITPTYPVVFPGDGQLAPYRVFDFDELPQALAACPGYGRPSGAWLSLQLGSEPNVEEFQLTKENLAGTLDACVFTGSTYTNPDPLLQDLGQQFLNALNAVIIMPKEPLTPGVYYVSVTSNGEPITWSFVV